MATSAGDDPGGSLGSRLPHFMDPRGEFGRLTYLQMTAKEGHELPKNPFIIGKSVESVVGTIESASSEAQGSRYTLRVRKQDQVNKLLSLSKLIDGTPISIVHHPRLNVSHCKVSSYDLLEMDEKEIQEQLANQGVIGVKRFTFVKDGNKVSSATLKLTFNSTTYPEHVKVGLLRVATQKFYPNPLQYYGCYGFSHTSLRCPGPKRCYNCSGEHLVEECNENSHCINCGEGHRPTFRKCSIYQREQSIVKIKIDHNLTYPEARKRVLNGNNSYATVAAQSRLDNVKLSALIDESRNKDVKIAQLVECLNKKSQEVEALVQKMESMRSYIAKLTERIRSDSQHEPSQVNRQSKEPKNQIIHQTYPNTRSRSKRRTLRDNVEKATSASRINTGTSPECKTPKLTLSESNPRTADFEEVILPSDIDEAGPSNLNLDYFFDGTQK